jgi:hypothetical protein
VHAVLLNSTLIGYGLFQLDPESAEVWISNLPDVAVKLAPPELESLLMQIFDQVRLGRLTL